MNDHPPRPAGTVTRRGWIAGGAAFATLPEMVMAQAGGLQALDLGATVELRGLGVARGVRWASGAKGTVIRGGAVLQVPGAAGLDFRGLHAFSDRAALAMSAGPGEASQLWRTVDAGKSWSRVAVNTDPQGFWDAIAFADARRGFILGDPTEGRFTLLRTTDAGASWTRASAAAVPPMVEGEAAFAASNGSLAIGPRGLIAFCTGGAAAWARAYVSRDGGRSFLAMDTPVAAGAPSRGAFACAYDEAGCLWVCGGDYQAPTAGGVNVARLEPGAPAFQAVEAPQGYLSSIAARHGVVIAAGLSGVIVARGSGALRRISAAPFNTVRLTSATQAELVGPKGSVAVWRG